MNLLERFLSNKDLHQPRHGKKSRKKKSALREINQLMKFSNNMENNIRNLNIKNILTQEFSESKKKVEEFGMLDELVHGRFAAVLKKRDSVFLKKVKVIYGKHSSKRVKRE